MLENRVIRKNFVHRAARILVFSLNPGWVFERTTVLDLQNPSPCYAHRQTIPLTSTSQGEVWVLVVSSPADFALDLVSQPEPFRFQVHDHSSSLSAPSSDSFTIQNTAPRSFFSQRPSARYFYFTIPTILPVRSRISWTHLQSPSQTSPSATRSRSNPGATLPVHPYMHLFTTTHHARSC